ncbi:GerAB/ArcD/ProY family transporter [Thermoflavimicrobium daqui]|uniref:Spore gernimation protein n=1 Tax=Thermoflavimicrobium daqui TaxID=2137476 RepID=A0A364K1X2_9BACL|nr:endospore germination permease [Thermoflavimicrobium daqui]RAL22026.1 spore gernimation protein [Thermoflavimicrobium daqui]
MPKENQVTLSTTQFTFTIYKTQIGIAILTIPRELVEISGWDAIISMTFGWLVALIIGFLVIHVMKNNPNETIYEILPKYFGKWIGKSLCVIWILYSFLIATVILLTTVDIICLWILPNTPTFLIMLSFIIPIYMLIQRGLQAIGRFAEIAYLITIWMPLILLVSLKNGQWLNLLPVIKEGWLPIFQFIKLTAPAFLGFEIIFVLYPFLEKKKEAAKGFFIANTLTLVIYLFALLICYIRFSQAEIRAFIWPTLNLLKLIQFPFLERLEIIFLSFYIIILLMSVVPYFYMSLMGVNRLFHKKKHIPLLPMVCFIWLIIPFIKSPSYFDVIVIGNVTRTITNIVTLLMTTILYLYSYFYRWLKKERVP